MRIGLFGGSFDPVHLGHLLIAETAREALGLDEVRWLPAAQSPLKPSGPVASAADRLTMLRLACGGTPSFVIDDRELERGGVSYTVETLAEFAEAAPAAERFLLMGADSLASIRQWHQPERLLQLCTPAVLQRGGHAGIDWSVLEGLVADSRRAAMEQAVVPMPLIEISSTDLRERVAGGRSIRFRTPRPVEAYIASTGLYRTESPRPEA
jgi:nicotinate-nucleotide adenylyltransferase